MSSKLRLSPSSSVVPPAWTPWVIVGVMLFPVLVMTRADPDLWGHVRFGLDMLIDHALPRVDPYSFTQDVDWVNHEWLSELLMGAAYRAGGAAALALFKGALVAIFFAVVLSLYVGTSPPVAGAALVLLAAGTGRMTTTLRPQLWSLLGMAVLCRVLITTPSRWWLVGVPVVFALWVNLHGGWIVGAGVLAVWTVFQFWRQEPSRALVVGVALLSAVATLMNPYGWHLWAFLAATVRMSRPITEWQPLWTTPVLAWVPWLAVVGGLVFAVSRTFRPPSERIAIVALLALVSLRVERLSGLCIVAAVVLMSPTLLAGSDGPPSFDPLSRRAATAAGFAVLALALISAGVTERTASCISISGDWVPDRIAGRALVEGKAQGTMVTWFDWGEYAIWHLSPALRVSLDGRRETIYSDAVLSGHEALNAATPEGIAYLQRLDPTYVWLPSSSSGLGRWLETHGYRLDVRTPQSVIAVREDRPVLRVPHDPLNSCFPGP
jgi:hypothetical protein